MGRPAHAAYDNAYESGSTLYYVANPGEPNNVIIRLTGDGYTIDDVVPIDPGYNCKHRSADTTFVVCISYGISTVWVETYDQNDNVDYLTPTYSVVKAGDGDDTVWGGTGTDALWGGSGNDYLNGWSGNDWIVGGVGTDQLYGGSGTSDTVPYTDSPVAVAVDLDGAADDGAAGENDTIGSDFEELHGSMFNDRLTGNGNANSIYGLAGNDYLYGLGGGDYLYGDGFSDYVIGSDYFSGGSGTDFVGYSDHTTSQPVTADLDGASADDGASGEGDTIAADVENLDGSPGADVLTGNASVNQIDGLDGNDALYGLGGNDSLFSQEGNDWVYGGDDDDLLTGEAGNDHLYGQNNADTLNGVSALTRAMSDRAAQSHRPASSAHFRRCRHRRHGTAVMAPAAAAGRCRRAGSGADCPEQGSDAARMPVAPGRLGLSRLRRGRGPRGVRPAARPGWSHLAGSGHRSARCP